MAIFLDVTSTPRLVVGDILLPDVRAIFNSLRNLYTCPIGSRAFEPEYGTSLWHHIYEPCDQLTALAIDNTLVVATERWEPRCQLIKRQGLASPLDTGDGFFVSVPIYIPKLGKYATYELTARR